MDMEIHADYFQTFHLHSYVPFQVSALREQPAPWSECLSKTREFCGSDREQAVNTGMADACSCNKVQVLMTLDS